MAIDNQNLPEGFVLENQQKNQNNSELPEDFILENQPTGFTSSQFETFPQETQRGLEMPIIDKALLRTTLAFGDNPQFVQKWLQNKFPNREIRQIKGRKFSIDGIPIDPEGFLISDLPYDILDTADEMIRIGGQIFGATRGMVIGTAVTPGIGTAIGGIVGGGAGRAGAQATVETIGRYFGIQGAEEFGEVAGDIAREGAIGAAGEIFGLGLRAISKPTTIFLKNMFKKIQTKFSQPALQNFFNFTSNVQKESIQRIQQRGTEIVLTRENMGDDALLRIGEIIQQTAGIQRTELGQAVKVGKGIIKGKIIADIDITDLKKAFGVALQDVDLLNSNFRPLKPIVGKLNQGQKDLLDIFGFIRPKNKISPSVALKLRNKIDSIIDFARTGDRVISVKEEAILKGIRDIIKEKLIQVSDDFAKANADFTAFAAIDDALQGKLDLNAVEIFLKNILKGPAFYKEYLYRLNDSAAKSTGKNDIFMNKLLDIVAARDFASGTFRGIRSGLIGGGLGTLGLGIPPQLSLPIGIAVSTPRMVGGIIKGQQATGRMMKALLQKGGAIFQEIAPRATSSILSRLLSKQ